MLVLAAFLTPLVEFFDQWDPPGPSNDTELAVFSLILALAFVLLLAILGASLAGMVVFSLVLRMPRDHGSPSQKSPALCTFVIPPIPSPLRI